MSDQQDRPKDLRVRRRPQPATDERVDPVDYQQRSTNSSQTPERTITESSAPARRGRPRREVTVPFSTRLSPEIVELIDAASENGETIRSVIEEAVRSRYGSRR
jgi:hypothetical protein